MRGTKRLAVSGSIPSTNDSAFQNKRIMSGFSLGAQRAEPSENQSPVIPRLDVEQSELANKHVRALNNQFASWIQAQLKNHPDELWEDGVRDYLTHASNIMAKFRDVVEWLKANPAKTGNSSPSTENKFGSEVKNNEVKLFQENKDFKPFQENNEVKPSQENNEVKPSQENNEVRVSQEKNAFSPANSTTGFATPWSSGPFSSNTQSGLFSNNQFGLFNNSKALLDGQSSVSFSNNSKPAVSFSYNASPTLFGNQGSMVKNQDTSDAVDAEEELPQPSSPSVQKSEEKGIIVVHEVKVKLYVKSSDPENKDKDAWKDKGTGQLCIKCKEGVSKGTKESKPTIVVRNDVGKIVLNALLYPGIKTSIQKNSIVAIFHTSDGENENVMAHTFLIRTRTEEDRDKLGTAIKDYAPAS